MNPSSTLQYFKKPFFWKLGYLKLNRKAKIVGSTVGEAEVNLETCTPLTEDGPEASLSLTAFKGELDSAVSQYLSQVKDLGYKGSVDEGTKDKKLLEVKFKLDPDEIKPRSASEQTADGKEAKPKIKVISREEKGEQTQLEVELPSLDNPLYITLSECSTGLFEHLEEGELEDCEEVDEEALNFEHYYENGQIGSEDEHIYENVENSNSEGEEHLYDTLPRHKPDVPPKPDFLAQLAARQSEPVKRAWNPFVNLNVDTDETPSFSTASPLSSPSSDNSANSGITRKLGKNRSNPFQSSRPRETSEQTLILDGSETSDLGSSGGEDEIRSVEDWPLPPTPPPGEAEIIEEDNPLPPPPPELALQELEEAVIREEEEERKLALQKEKEAIERDYGSKAQDYEDLEQVEAVNETLTSLEDTYASPCKKKKELVLREVIKEPKIIQIDDDDYEDFNTPAIRHSVIIALKDSIPSIPQSIKPSDIRRKESLKRSESLKKVGLFKPKDSKHHIERRESIFKLFPQTVKSEPKVSRETGSISVGVVSPKQEIPPLEFLESRKGADQVIEISEDGSWEMKKSMDQESANQANKPDIDPFTGIPIMAPPLSPVSIPAPPSEFQTNDGTDGVFSADIVTTHSGPSSLASTITDSTAGDLVPPATPTLLTPSEAIQEESTQESENMTVAKVNGNETEFITNGRVTDSPGSQQKNIGAAIMQSYENEFLKKKESMNLPEVSLLEFGDSVRDLEEQRKSVIKQMTVKAKKKDTWIKTCHMHSKGNEDSIPVAPSRARRKNSPSRPNVCEATPVPHAKSDGQMDDEILENVNPVEVDIPKIASLIETINDSVEQSQIGMLQMGPEEPKAPPKVSRKHKKSVPKADAAPVNLDKVDNQEASIEEVISPKNTEILAAFFSSPVKTAKIPEVNQSPPLPPRAKEIQNKELLSQPLEAAFESEGLDEDHAESDITPEVKRSEVHLERLISVDEPSSENLMAMNKPTSETILDNCHLGDADFEEDPLVKEKNAINVGHSIVPQVQNNETNIEFEKDTEIKEPQIENEIPAEPAERNKEQVIDVTAVPDLMGDEGEVEYFSILDNKSATKTYWETRMLATMDDGGWESVANVRFQPVPGVTPVVVQGEESMDTVTPPPEFMPAPPPQFDNSPVDSEGSSPPSMEDPLKEQPPHHDAEEDSLPAKKYVYGVNEQEKHGVRVVETVAKKPSSQENVIEAEIMAQQLKEDELRQEVTLKNTVLREKGASSPASHDSDEGFVDRLGEDVAAVTSSGYPHGLREHDGEGVIYNAVSPPPEYFGSGNSTPTPSSNTETKIALEIRELKEREEELRRMRAQLTSSRDTLNEDEESRSSASREQLLEDHFTSFTTTTDEGNYSECGDAVSSEDKSSDGSNSRIMSPELLHPGTHLDFSRRKVTVKPFEDEEEDQPVYTRMQKESVIEREIRLAREREEAFRREKGLLQNSAGNVANRPNNNNNNNTTTTNNNNNTIFSRPSAFAKEDPRDVQHRMATSRIQLEIQETCEKEKELRDAGKILTTSEETVDAKVTRMSDFTDLSQIDSAWNRTPTSSSTSSSPSPRSQSVSGPAPNLKRSPSPRSPSSPVPSFNLAPPPPPSRGMTKSLSTTNLASPTTPTGVRAPKGLMQKFIASRGKMTTSAFSSPPPNNLHITSTSRGIPTRPMRVEPKAAVLQRETISRLKPAPQTNGDADPAPATTNSNQAQPFRRSYCTAEEKIQLELREMQQREEELRRHRARLLAQSQPNLAGLALDEEDFEPHEDAADSLHEMNGLRAVLSNPNLLEDEPEQTQAVEKGVRRRSALIAQWENRIQKADT
ncbi:microtubule-associated protein futsch-like isoform X2 [Macrobrachium nipponense]|uniref:microtubule-associated protein futsch-like isoform X2 n=1 Tax=Macrobrachium nipponense TaxID=159736 RepID=UPI0030C814AA